MPDRRLKVRQAVLDAKEELQRDQQLGQSRAGGATGSGASAGQGGGGGDDAGVGLAGLFSLVRNLERARVCLDKRVLRVW